MEKASVIIKTADLNDLIYYIEYVEILMDITKKRNIVDKDLEEEHLILSNRYKELSNMKSKQ